MDFCMIFDLRTKTGGKEKKALCFLNYLPPNSLERQWNLRLKKKQKREGRPIERQTKGKGGGQSTDILQRGSCGRQQEPHPQATLKCWTDQNQKEPWALHVTTVSIHRKVICGQSNNHSVKRHEERTSLPQRQQETRFTPSVWCPTIPSTHVSLTFLHLWTKMSEFPSSFFFFSSSFKNYSNRLECVCPFWGGNWQSRQRQAGPFHKTGAVLSKQRPWVVSPVA